MCAAVVRYAEKNEALIMSDSPISVKNILDYYKDNFPNNAKAKFLSEYLNAYFLERKAFMDDMEKSGDRSGNLEVNRDQSYTFSHGGVTRLF
jgi:hypothetical protein